MGRQFPLSEGTDIVVHTERNCIFRKTFAQGGIIWLLSGA